MSELRINYPETLLAFNIKPTPVHVTLLRIITERFPDGFSLYQVFDEIEKDGLSISTLSVVATLGLFRLKGLVKKNRDEQRESNHDLICALNYRGHYDTKQQQKFQGYRN